MRRFVASLQSVRHSSLVLRMIASFPTIRKRPSGRKNLPDIMRAICDFSAARFGACKTAPAKSLYRFHQPERVVPCASLWRTVGIPYSIAESMAGSGPSPRQRGNGAVGLAYYPGQRHAGMTLRELGKYLGEVEYPAVSIAIARFRNRLKTERS